MGNLILIKHNVINVDKTSKHLSKMENKDCLTKQNTKMLKH